MGGSLTTNNYKKKIAVASVIGFSPPRLLDFFLSPTQMISPGNEQK